MKIENLLMLVGERQQIRFLTISKIRVKCLSLAKGDRHERSFERMDVVHRSS